MFNTPFSNTIAKTQPVYFGFRLDPTNHKAAECLNMLMPNFSSNKNQGYFTVCEGGASHTSQSTSTSEDVETESEYWPNNSDIITID